VGQHALQRGDTLDVRAGVLVFSLRSKEFPVWSSQPWPTCHQPNINHADQAECGQWAGMRLTHGWKLIRCPGLSDAWITEGPKWQLTARLFL